MRLRGSYSMTIFASLLMGATVSLGCAQPSSPILQNKQERGFTSAFARLTFQINATLAEIEFGEEFKLRNGEAARISSSGLKIGFERVTSDGRCPAGDPCVSDVGDAVVLISAEQPPHEPAALELHTNPSSTAEGQYLRYGVRLVRLEPRPIGEQQVPLPQYWATFVVSR